MSETSISGDAGGPVLSGAFSGPTTVGGSAHITFQQLVQQEMQQETPIELRAATMRDMILGLGRGVQGLVERMEDHIDAETDARKAETAERQLKQAEHQEQHKEVGQRLQEMTAQMRDFGARVFRMELTMLISLVVSTGALMLGIGLLLWLMVTR